MASAPERNSQNVDDAFRDAPGKNAARDAAGVAADSSAGDFLDDTIAVWQPLSQRPLTREDAREITENMVGFFSVLREWAEAERNPEMGLPPPPPGSPAEGTRLRFHQGNCGGSEGAAAGAAASIGSKSNFIAANPPS